MTSTDEVRARVGAERRRRTRQALVESAVEVIAAKGLDNVTIEDFVRAAGVSRGSFYNHFPTQNDLIVAVAEHLAQEVSDQAKAIGVPVEDPAERVAIGVMTVLGMARRQPAWARIILRLADHEGMPERRIARNFLTDFHAGVAEGRFVDFDEGAAVDLLTGVVLRAVRSIAAGRTPSDYDVVVTAAILRGLGLSPDDAQLVARRRP